MFNIINNGTLSTLKCMPQKDLTSDGTDSFAKDRYTYVNTLQTQSVPLPVQTNKKFFGNRDASEVIRNRRVNEVGLGTLNANKIPTSFTNTVQTNTVRDAITRVRAGGASAPAKKRAMRTNAPTPSFPAGPLVRTANRSVQPIQNKTAMAYKNITGSHVLYH
jgi:hypothetical protein